MSANLSPAVALCTTAIFRGSILHASDVTAGNGVVVDWRHVPSGETLCAGVDAFDAAYLFVELVGPEAAVAAALRRGERFAEVSRACPNRVELPLERRPANALNLEIGQGLDRCMVQRPAHWPEHMGALRWLASGGTALVLGPCSAGECPLKA